MSEQQHLRPDRQRHQPDFRQEPKQSADHWVDANPVLTLHQTVGNQTVQRWLRAGTLPRTAIVGQQQAFGNKAIQRMLIGQRRSSSSSSASADAGEEVAAVGRSLADSERRYQEMIRSARSQGYDVAADNLEYWLNGRGGERRLAVAWLRSFDAVTKAEETNQERFERQLKARAAQLTEGATATFSDHWDRALTAGMTTELFYASGTSQLTSRGTFVLRRTGRLVTITGTVQQHWHDPYNWNAGQGAYIPGFGVISDDDALALKAAGIGADYDLVADWLQSCTGSVDIGHVYDTIDLTWTGP